MRKPYKAQSEANKLISIVASDQPTFSEKQSLTF